jgi:hypothetical protein
MVRKTDSPNTRRLHFLHRGSISKPKVSRMQRKAAQIGATSEDLARCWDESARIALKLERMTVANLVDTTTPSPVEFPDISFDALSRAFAHFKLDPGDPLHWRLLLNHFAYIHFGKPHPKPTGPASTWNADRMGELKLDLVKRGYEKKPAAAEAARIINRDKRSSFHGAGREALRKKIGDVRLEIRKEKLGGVV